MGNGRTRKPISRARADPVAPGPVNLPHYDTCALTLSKTISMAKRTIDMNTLKKRRPTSIRIGGITSPGHYRGLPD